MDKIDLCALNGMKQTVLHPIPPVYDEKSEILILGSFPSVKSREANFFYGHPQNRFWKVLGEVFHAPVPQTVPEKKAFLLAHHVALWDVIARCEIDGSADSSIRNPEANDLTPLLTKAPIRIIAVNGQTAKKYYDRLLLPQTGVSAMLLPSTSPANAAWSLPRLVDCWSAALLRERK